MKRILVSVVLATVLLSLRANAQVVDIDVGAAIATTHCVRAPSGVGFSIVSIINMEKLDSPNLEEYVVHEREHRRQFAADTTLCAEIIRAKKLLTSGSKKAPDALAHWFPKLLKLEVEAYCVSAQVPIKHGAFPESVYLFDQNLLLGQLSDVLDREIIMTAWYNQCGQLLGLH